MMPRKPKRSAWGSIAQVDESTWRIRFWAKGADGQYKRRSVTVRGTRKQAEQKRAELMLAHSEDAPCPTVGTVWRTWVLPDLDRRVESGDVSASTVAQYRGAWNKHVEPRWGGTECDAVRPLAVQQWLYGLNLSAAKMALVVLRMTLDYAVRYELVEHNAARERYVMPSPSTVERRDAGVWSLDELGELWRAVWGQWYEPVVLLCGFGGLRVGEALGVRGDDVGEMRGCAVVSVERQVNVDEITDALKTEQSRRAVPIPGRAGRRLIELADGCDGYLAGDGLGGFTPRSRLTYAWASAPVPDGLRHPLRNLRNSWQTNMRWQLRLPPYLIEPMMGHVGQGVTGRFYDRPSAEMFADAMADAYAQNTFDAGWTWADGTK